MAPSIVGMVFRLRRRLASERAQVAAYEFVDTVMRQWDDFSRSDAEVTAFVLDLWPRDTFLPNHDLALEYLQRCKTRGEKPERGFLTESLFPWFFD